MLDLYEVSFNPNDISFVSLVGKNIFKCYKLIENVDENNQRKSTLE